MTADLFTRLAERTLGKVPVAQPVLPSAYESGVAAYGGSIVEGGLSHALSSAESAVEDRAAPQAQKLRIANYGIVGLQAASEGVTPAGENHDAGNRVIVETRNMPPDADSVINADTSEDFRAGIASRAVILPDDINSIASQNQPDVHRLPAAATLPEGEPLLAVRRAGPMDEHPVEAGERDAPVFFRVESHLLVPPDPTQPTPVSPAGTTLTPRIQPAPVEPARPSGSRHLSAEIPAAAPAIRVTIGRIEVRAVQPPSPAARLTLAPRPPVVSLDDYLDQRNGAGR